MTPKILDVGCGDTPHKKANFGLDISIEPFHRDIRRKIIITKIKEKVTFVIGDIYNLPFKKKSFDAILCTHLLEHLSNPFKACLELMRVGKGGYIETPSPFGEIMFGRLQHKWLVFSKKSHTLIFMEKEDYEFLPFGDGANFVNERLVTDENTNPFDILLNYNDWYSGPESYPRLTKLLRKYWFTGIMRTRFKWTEGFNIIIIKDKEIMFHKTDKFIYNPERKKYDV